MTITLVILVLTALLFAWGRLRSDIVALMSLIALLLAGILTPHEALSGFSNPVVIMMGGLFIVGGGIFQTGLAKKVSGQLMRLAGDSEWRMFLLVMCVTGAIGAFVSNTGTVALMLPIVVSLANQSSFSARRLLMPLAFASSMGGMFTLIGTPPNLVIADVLEESGYGRLQFFSFLPVGLICLGVGIVVLLPLTRWLLKEDKSSDVSGGGKGKTLSQLVQEYGLREHVTCVCLPRGSKAIDRTIAQLNIHQRYALTVLEVRRTQRLLVREVTQRMVTPDTRLAEEDMLFLSGPQEAVDLFVCDYGLKTIPEEESLRFYNIGLAEIVLLRQSKFVGRKLSEAGFRHKYSVNVLAVRRNNEYVREHLADLKLQEGDVLLLQGTWEQIGRLSDDEDYWVVLGQPLEQASQVTIDYKAPLAALIMFLMVMLMVLDFIPVAPVTAVLLAAVLMILTGCFRSVEAAYKTINWESIILIGAMMPMSLALEKTGASQFVSRFMVDTAGSWGPYALMAGIYLVTSLLTFFLSNTATAVLMAPIAMSAARDMGVHPLPLLFAVTVAASMCFASPFSTPPNALVMKAGRYSFSDYVRVGLPLQAVIGLVMVLAIPLLFPF